MGQAGKLFGVGVGPGDPSLMTVRAVEVLQQVRVVAFFAKAGSLGNAHAVAKERIHPEAEQLPLVYPYTTELSARAPGYIDALRGFYDAAAERIAERLGAGHDVAVLCEGDPLMYGSYIYVHERLAPRFASEVVPGITSFAGCAARAGVPMVSANRRLSVVPGTLDEPELERCLAGDHAVAVIKLGSNFGKVRRVLERLGRLEGALYYERGTTPDERAMPLRERGGERSPYFSLILVPSHDHTRLGAAELSP